MKKKQKTQAGLVMVRFPVMVLKKHETERNSFT